VFVNYGLGAENMRELARAHCGRGASWIDERGRKQETVTWLFQSPLPLPRSEPCSMVGRQTSIGIRRDHLLAAHSSDHRIRCAQSYRVLTTREETMIGT